MIDLRPIGWAVAALIGAALLVVAALHHPLRGDPLAVWLR